MVVELVASEGKCEVCGYYSQRRVILDTEFMSHQEREVIYNVIERRFGKEIAENLSHVALICPECYKLLMEEYNRKFNGGNR